MIWETATTATWFNTVMLVLFSWVLIYTRNNLPNARGYWLILFAVISQGTIYVVELVALHVLPAAISEHAASTTLTVLQRVRPPVTALALISFTVAFILINHRSRALINALRESRSQLGAILDATPDGILTLNRNGEVATANDAAERLFDGPRHWLIGTPIRDLLPDVSIHPDEVTTVAETPARRRTGSQFTASVTVRMSGARRREHVVTVRDVTRQQELEAALRRSQRLDAIGQLSGGIAHDFNNQLTVILGYLQMIEETDPSPELRTALTRIREAAQHSSRLTGQLLAFSRRQLLEPRVVNMNVLIRGMMELVRSSVGEQIRVDALLGRDLHNVRVDPSQLEQVLMNLVLNARDAMAEGGTLRIETADVRLDERYCETHGGVVPGAYAMLSVADDGAGIEADALDHIFEPFFTTKDMSSGLGLATVQGIVAQSGGSIDVVSRPGRGTTFKVFLPRVEAEADVPVASHAAATPVPSNGGRVLVVEDEAPLRELIAATLARQGYEVCEAADGDEAVRVGLACMPDILITDVVMPSGTGVEVNRALRGALPELTVIYMSGYSDELLTDDGEPAAALHKPFTPDQLIHRVRTALEERRQGNGTRAQIG